MQPWYPGGRIWLPSGPSPTLRILARTVFPCRHVRGAFQSSRQGGRWACRQEQHLRRDFHMSATGQVIPAFLINLERRPDRLERVSEHLGHRGVAFERVDACDGQSADEAVLGRVALDSGPLGGISRGHRACAVSHSWTWQHFLDGTASHALILEDDIFLSADFAPLLRDSGWIPHGADLIKLEKYGRRSSRLLLGRRVGQTPSGRPLYPLRSRHGGTGAYMLSRKGAEQALAQCGHIDVPVDHLLFSATLSGLCRSLRPVIVCPGMATQYAYPYNSDTWTQGPPVPLARWRRTFRKLRRGANEVRLLPLQTAELLFCGARLRTVEFQEDPPSSPGSK